MRSKKSISFILMFLFFAVICFAQKKAVYNMFLEEPVPINRTVVVFNPPVFRWPYQKGKQVKYDIQISKDSAFADQTTISAEGLLGAMYNPHQHLASGIWYWHYKISGKAWSSLLYFIVNKDALEMLSPASDAFLAGVPQNHPRILTNRLNDDLKSFSKGKDAAQIIADADKVMGQKILTEADAQPAAKGKNEKQEKKLNQDAVVGLGNEVNQMVLNLCEAGLLTGNSKYQIKAIDIAMEVAGWDEKGISGSSDFIDGICMYNMALVFDTFFDKLTDTQKEILLKAIKERANKFYKSWVNNIESKVLSGHVWQLILNEFFKTSIALYKHEPAAAQWLSYAYELFLARSPVLGGLDGGWGEGASYFQMNMEMLIEIPDKIKLYTGFDFIKAHPWYQNQADWLIYNFPAGSSSDGFGDNTEELFEPPACYAAFAEEMAKLTQNPKYSWYAQQLLQHQKIELSTEPKLRWFRLLHANENALPKATDSLHFQMAHLSKEVGVAALHTNISSPQKDIMVAMRASPYGAYGHILADQNTFNILFGGERLFFRTGYKVAMDDPHRIGWSKNTKSMNGVLINGFGQPYSAEAYGYFSRFLQGGHLAYIKGDASNAYQSTETKEDYGVNKFYRHIVLLKPNIIVIYDELESQADANWSWLIHSLTNMKLDSANNSFTSIINSAKGVGKLWCSQPFSWNITDKFDVPAVIFRNYTGMRVKEYKDQWHVKATNKEKTNKIRFLSIIQVQKKGDKILEFKQSDQKSGTVKISIGDWNIEASMLSNLPPQLNIYSVTNKTAFVAYGNELRFQDQIFKGSIHESSKLAEWINGKIKFSEVGDEPLPPIR